MNANVPCREWPWSGRIQPPAESTIRDGVAPFTALSRRGFRRSELRRSSVSPVTEPRGISWQREITAQLNYCPISLTHYQSHSLTRVHRILPLVGKSTLFGKQRGLLLSTSVTPLMSTDPRPGHVLKAASASGVLARVISQGDVIDTPYTALQNRQDYPGSVLMVGSAGTGRRGCAASRGLSAFIAPGWLRMSCCEQPECS